MQVRLADPGDPALREAWTALAAGAAEPNPFFEPATLLPAVTLLPGGRDARLLVVEDGGSCVLALPVVRAGRGRPALSSWQHPYCYAGAPLLASGAGPTAWDAALSALRRTAGVRVLVLPRLPLDGPAARALDAALGARGLRSGVTRAFDRPVLRRRPEPTYLHGRLGARSRKALRRNGRRLAEALGAEPALLDAGGDRAALPGAIEALLAVERSGWKGAAGTALACDPAAAEFFRRTCALFAADGRLQLWTLGVPDRPAAVQANLVAGSTVFHYKIAYDEDLAPFSPGLQLEVAMVEEFHRDHRLDVVDSCTDPGPTVSARLYPDRQRLGTVLVPLDRGIGRVVARGAPRVLAGGRSVREAVRTTARTTATGLRRRAPGADVSAG